VERKLPLYDFCAPVIARRIWFDRVLSDRDQYVDILNSAGIVTALISRREKVQEGANAAFITSSSGCYVLYYLVHC
jgi:hypothetical protein